MVCFSGMGRLVGFVTLLLLAGSCKKKEIADPVTNFRVTGYYPNSGKGGTLVTMLGEGFSTDLTDHAVSFSGTPAEVISATETKLVVRAPQAGSTGMVTLSTDGKNTDVGQFTYQSLSVQQLIPDKAQGGAQIKIRGEGFSSVSGPPKVIFNGKNATVLNASDTLLVVEVPRDGNGVAPVQVEVDGMEATGPIFSYMSIEQMKPLSGGAGTYVTILGEGFDETITGNKVTFNGMAAVVTEASTNRLVVVAPQSVRSGPVIITIGDEVVQAPNFTVVPFPVIETVSPLSGPGGVEMVIIGTQFSPAQGETNVYINDIKIVPTSVTATQIKLILPGGTGNGKVVVNVNDQATEGPVFRDQALAVTLVSPADGLPGTAVTIHGAGFSTIATENRVTFNGVQTPVITATESSLQVLAPQGLTTGMLRVEVGGLYAEGPTEFRRAGILSLGHGQLQLSTAGGSIAVDNQENVYVLEIGQHRVMKITPGGQVSLFAGSTTGSEGNQDGTGENARFRLTETAGLAYDRNTNVLYLTDPGNRALKRISMQGTVSTVIANLGDVPGKIALKPDGSELFVSNVGYTTRQWIVAMPAATFRSVSLSHGNRHVRHAVTQQSVVYSQQIATFTGAIGIYTPNGSGGWTGGGFGWAGASSRGYLDAVGGAARFGVITGFTLDGPDHLMVLDPDNSALRRVNVHTAEVTTAFRASSGFADGDFRQAKWSANLRDLDVGSDGSIYVLDCGNNAVRKVMLR